MTGPRILIVTYNWPPRNAIGTHRPYAWAKYWSEAGARVTVLTAAKRAFDAPLDLYLPVPAGVRVIEVPYGGAGLSVIDRWSRNRTARNILKWVRGRLRNATAATTDPRSGWRTAAQPLVAELAKENDFVVSTYGPEACHLLAHDIKTVSPRLIWVADYRDLWSQSPMGGWTDGVKASIRSLEEASVGRHADVVTAVSEDMVEKLGEFCRGRRILSPNGFDLELRDLEKILASSGGRNSKPLRLVHTGTVYPDQRDPTPLLETLANMLERGELRAGDVVLEFYGGRVTPILQLMKNPRFEPFLRVPGHVAREEAIRIQREADLLLLLESSAPEARGVLTGKVFEYISAGRPILCIGSRPEFEIGLLLRRTGTGVVADLGDPDSIASIIRHQLSDLRLPDWFAPNLEEIGKYTRKGQAIHLLAEMNKVDLERPALN